MPVKNNMIPSKIPFLKQACRGVVNFSFICDSELFLLFAINYLSECIYRQIRFVFKKD
jgi:hypothetical protein